MFGDESQKQFSIFKALRDGSLSNVPYHQPYRLQALSFKSSNRHHSRIRHARRDESQRDGSSMLNVRTWRQRRCTYFGYPAFSVTTSKMATTITSPLMSLRPSRKISSRCLRRTTWLRNVFVRRGVCRWDTAFPLSHLNRDDECSLGGLGVDKESNQGLSTNTLPSMVRQPPTSHSHIKGEEGEVSVLSCT